MDAVTVTLPRALVAHVLDAIKASGIYHARRAGRSTPEGIRQMETQAADAMRAASALLGDAIDAPDEKRFL